MGILLPGCAASNQHSLRPIRIPGGVESRADCGRNEAACPAPAGPGSCTYSQWAAPQPLAGVPSGAVIRSPSLGTGAETGYVVGNDIALFDSLPTPPHPLIAMTDAGQDIGRPAGDFVFASPRASVDAGGTLHVVWAEPRERPVQREDWLRFIFDYASLWHAAYTPGRGWTPPARVYAGSRVSWYHGTGGLATAPGGGLHGVTGDDSAQALIHLSFDGGAWHSRRIPGIERRPAYASLAVGEGGRIYVAFVAADRDVPSDANSVFLVRSADGGRTWLPPQRISRSGSRQATQIRALAAPGGTVHLVWAQNISGGLAPEVVRHTASRDGGETWSPHEDADIPDGLGMLEAVVDRCGAVHVIHEALEYREEAGSEQGRLWYARWNGGWTAPAQPFGDLDSTEAALAIARDGSLRLLWTVVRPAENVRQTAFSTVVSHLGPPR